MADRNKSLVQDYTGFNYTDVLLDHSKTDFIRNTSFHTLSDPAIYLLYVNAFLILVSNLVILICLFTHRRNFTKNVFWHQIFCLCCNDIFVGFVSLLCVNIMTNRMISTKQIPCALVIILYFGSQIMTICHVFGICIQRLVCVLNIKKAESLARNSTYKTATLQMLFSVITGLAQGVTCFMLLPQDTVNMQFGCSAVNAMGENIKYINLIIFILLLLPLTLTNVLYGISIKVLRKKTMELKRDFTVSCHNGNSDNSSSAPEELSVRRTMLQKLHTRATVTVGLLLFFLNLFTWPYVFQSILIQLRVINPSQPITQTISTLMTMNSLINPFIYTIQVKEFRVALKDNLWKFVHFFSSRGALWRDENNEVVNCVDQSTQTDPKPTAL